MRTLFRDIAAWVKAVLSETLTVIGSAVVAALAFANEHYKWVDVGSAAPLKLLAIGLFIAAFRAWRKERDRRQAFENFLDNDLTSLARLRTEGVNLQARQFPAQSLGEGEVTLNNVIDEGPTRRVIEWMDAHMKWAADVADVLRKRLPEDQWGRFTSLGELEQVEVDGPTAEPGYYRHRIMLRKQLAVLEELMAELRAQVNAARQAGHIE